MGAPKYGLFVVCGEVPNSMSRRDEVWSEVLQFVKSHGKFRISDLEFEDEQRATVRRVLREMEKYGWLGRNSQLDATWRLGEKGKKLLNVHPDIIRYSEE